MGIPALSVHQADHLPCHLCGQRVYGKQSITFGKFQDRVNVGIKFPLYDSRIDEFYLFLYIVLPTEIRKWFLR